MEKKMDIQGKINSLTLDLEYNILYRIRLKQLCRLKCVSKHWHDLISSQHFVKLLRQRQVNGNSEGTIIIYDRLCTLSYDFHADIVTDLTSLSKNPRLCSGFTKRLIGSSNGLLCLEDSVFVWLYNPATGASKIITHLGYCSSNSTGYSRREYKSLFGFGYNCFTDDYKVLYIRKAWFCDGPDRRTLEDEGAYIYSFRANSWKVIKNDLMYRHLQVGSDVFRINGESMVLTNNALHWLIRNSSLKECQKCVLASFDLKTEEYREMSLPDEISTITTDCKIHLSGLKHCLHIVRTTTDLSRMEIWIMKEYGVQQSWTKIFHCGLIDQLEYLPGSVYRLPFACAYSKSGQEILVGLLATEGMLLSCNLQRQQVSIVRVLPDQGNPSSTLPWIGSRDSPIDE